MIWWAWVLLGLALLALEMATPGGFYVLFFGVSALLVGALTGWQLIERPVVQWGLFSVLSIASLALFRRRLQAMFQVGSTREAIDNLRGEVAVLSADLPPGAVGKAELRGTVWTVRNVDSRRLDAGARCRVERAEGLTLLVRGEAG